MTLETQWLALTLMFTSGILLGIALDVYRVLKGKWQIGGWVVALVDLCYWLLAAFWIFGMLLWSTWGELRFYMLVTLFLGMALYFLTLSRPAISVIFVGLNVVQALIRLIRNIVRLFIWYPIMYVGLCIWAILRFMGQAVLRVVRLLFWLLTPLSWLCKPLLAWLDPIIQPIRSRLVNFFHVTGGIWLKMKNVFRRRSK